jgi:hypothetical protein
MCSTSSQSMGMLLNSFRGKTGGKSSFLCDQCMTYAVPALILASPLSSRSPVVSKPPLNETIAFSHNPTRAACIAG